MELPGRIVSRSEGVKPTQAGHVISVVDYAIETSIFNVGYVWIRVLCCVVALVELFCCVV